MQTNHSKSASPRGRLPKCPTGIQGLDEITEGGLPRGRPTLVCGGAGCGKTLFATEFLVRGAAQYGEPGVFMSFEETDAELKSNVASLGFDLAGLVRRKKIVLEHVYIERSEIHESHTLGTHTFSQARSARKLNPLTGENGYAKLFS
jgi:circadian clock protein KaiC